MQLHFRNRQKKSFFEILTILLTCAIAVGCFFQAYRESIHLYRTPDEARFSRPEEWIRVGGKIAPQSLKNSANGGIFFELEGAASNLPVSFTGLPPRLLKEGQDAIVFGHYENQVFVATEVLAKHDESYRPQQSKDVICPI